MNKVKNVVIFGTNDFAQLASFYLTHDSDYKVVAFTKHRNFISDRETFQNKDVWSFEELQNIYSPTNGNNYLFAPISDNVLRKQVYEDGLMKGYKFASYVSSKTTIFNTEIGANCFIQEDNTIQPFVEIGNNCILWAGNHIGHHSTIESNVFISSHVVISGHCTIKKGAWLGVNSTLRDGITIEENCIVGMSSVVTKSTEANKIYIGSPAKIKI